MADNPMAHSGRASAYTDLITAVLDLRSPAATEIFDQALADAVASGHLPESVARRLRGLQRTSVRDVIDHAAIVLPATLVSMERAHADAPPAGAPVQTTPEPETFEPETPAPEAPQSDMSEPENGDVEAEPFASETPVDLTARRLLVAGLRPIPDQPFP